LVIVGAGVLDGPQGPLSHGFAVPALRLRCKFDLAKSKIWNLIYRRESQETRVKLAPSPCLSRWERCPVRTLGGEGVAHGTTKTLATTKCSMKNGGSKPPPYEYLFTITLNSPLRQPTAATSPKGRGKKLE